MTTDTEIETEIQAKGLTAPRITLDQVQAQVAAADYQVFGRRLTVCCLTLRNGFMVTGESSCVDSRNFDQALGEKIARANAVNKIWELEGYLLMSGMAQPQPSATTSASAPA